MRAAAIDVGTNSTRLLVAEECPGGFRPLERRLRITRLGQDVDRRRVLSPEALRRTLAVVADYAAVCGEYGVEALRVTGTSAVRDAANKDDFLRGVAALTGVRPEILTGEQEGFATFTGAVSDLAGPGPFVVVDIGGGSTELIYGDTAPEHIVSLDIGCVRMLEKHIGSDPPRPAELEAVRSEADARLAEAAGKLGAPAGTRLIGVAGTVTQLAALKSGTRVYDPEVTHHMVLSHGDVRRLLRRLASLPLERRKRIRALEEGRADVIVPGAVILLAVMEAFDAPEVTVSEKDILDGLILEMLEP